MSDERPATGNAFVRTVLGDVPPGELGVTYCHEHLLTAPRASAMSQEQDLRLDDRGRAAAELRSFFAAGGRALVEVTTPEFGRDARGLHDLSRDTGVHVVATTGHVSESYWHGALALDEVSEEELVDELVVELAEGVDGTSIRAGVIKVGSSLDEITDAEGKVMRAAGRAQSETGAPVTTHTTAGTAALEQVRILEGAGADPSKVCIGHLDRRLIWEEHLAVARTGVYLGYDCISKEQYEPDATRARFIARLVEHGFGERICLSGDLARRSYLASWGGSPGYRHVIESFLPRLREEGLDEDSVRKLVVDNPAGLLAWRPRRP